MIRIKAKGRQTLQDEAVVALAQKVLANFGFKPLDEEQLLSEFKTRLPMPKILSNGIIQIWIDKYYIAYSYLDQEAVRYVYISKKHIEEEEHSYTHWRKDISIHPSILYEFFLAKRQMKKTNRKYAIFK